MHYAKWRIGGKTVLGRPIPGRGDFDLPSRRHAPNAFAALAAQCPLLTNVNAAHGETGMLPLHAKFPGATT
jgi:hypothetical protein